jgi:hypothetical protein
MDSCVSATRCLHGHDDEGYQKRQRAKNEEDSHERVQRLVVEIHARDDSPQNEQRQGEVEDEQLQRSSIFGFHDPGDCGDEPEETGEQQLYAHVENWRVPPHREGGGTAVSTRVSRHFLFFLSLNLFCGVVVPVSSLSETCSTPSDGTSTRTTAMFALSISPRTPTRTPTCAFSRRLVFCAPPRRPLTATPPRAESSEKTEKLTSEATAFLAALDNASLDPNRLVVAQTAPAVRVALSEGTCHWKDHNLVVSHHHHAVVRDASTKDSMN